MREWNFKMGKEKLFKWATNRQCTYSKDMIELRSTVELHGKGMTGGLATQA